MTMTMTDTNMFPGERVLITDAHLPHSHIWQPLQKDGARLTVLVTNKHLGVFVTVYVGGGETLSGWFKREWLYLPHDYGWGHSAEPECRRCGFYGPDNDDPSKPLSCPGDADG